MHDGVQLALARRLRQVCAVALQGAVLGLRRGAVHASATAHLLQGTVYLLLIDAEPAQDAHRLTLSLVGDGDEEVLHAHVLVLQPLRLRVSRLQHAHDARRGVDLDHVVGELGCLGQRLGDGLAKLGAVHLEVLEDAGRDAALVGEQRHEDVLHVPLAVALLTHHLLPGRQNLLRPFRKPVLSHHLTSPLAFSDLLSPSHLSF